MRIQTALVALTCCLAPAGVSYRLEAQPAEDATTEALRFFTDLRSGNGTETLRTLRPAQVSMAERRRAVADLPLSSVLQPNRREREQLASLSGVLVFHERQGVYDIKVIDVPLAAIALHARSVILISRVVLRLLSKSELQAAVAHEIGHEYFWTEYAPARARADTLSLRVLELKCDGVAAYTLAALGMDPRHLYTAIDKIGRFNEVPKSSWRTNGYPDPRDRQRFVSDLLESTSAK